MSLLALIELVLFLLLALASATPLLVIQWGTPRWWQAWFTVHARGADLPYISSTAPQGYASLSHEAPEQTL